jgi:hypothetical protein
VTAVRKWLRRNVWALAALAALMTTSIWYAFTIDWQQYQDGRPTSVIDVPRDKEAIYGGVAFSIKGVVVLEGDSADSTRYEVTPGTDVVVVDLSVTPPAGGDPDDYIGCDVKFIAPSPEGDRTWWASSSNPTTYPDPEDQVFGCNVAGGPAFVYRTYFVVPAGGAKDGAVLVTLLEELPLALHLH